MQIQDMSNKEITKASYEATAQEFAHNVANLAPAGSIKQFLTLLPNKAKIIDIGCGSGRDAKLFSEMGAEVTGIDFCSNLINIAKKNAPLAKFLLMDIETMNLPEASFDGVWSACSLGHISKKAFPEALKKIHALLKEQGYFYLALKSGSGETLEQDFRYDGDFKKFWSYFAEEELTSLLDEAHFKILDFALVEKTYAYQTHPAIRVFCQKA